VGATIKIFPIFVPPLGVFKSTKLIISQKGRKPKFPTLWAWQPFGFLSVLGDNLAPFGARRYPKAPEQVKVALKRGNWYN
jgi:hypothetical protein